MLSVIVTGGSRGLGLGMVRVLSSAGYILADDLVLPDGKGRDAVENAVEQNGALPTNH